jgi:hypothetical protein
LVYENKFKGQNMAVASDFLLSDPLLRVKHGQEITINYTEQSLFNPLMGSSNSAIIKTDLVDDANNSNSGSATIVTMHMRGLVRGEGVEDNTDFDANSDTLEYLSQDIKCGKMGNQIGSKDRNILSGTAASNFREDAKDSLTDWMKDRTDRTIMSRLSQDCTNIVPCAASLGFYNKNDTSSIKAGDFFNTKAIDEALRRARLGVDGTGSRHPRIRPYVVKTGDNNGIPVYAKLYVLMVGTNSAAQLQEDPVWISNQQLATERGETNNLFTGQLGMHNGAIIIQADSWTKEDAGIMNSSIGSFRGASSMGVYAGVSGNKTEINLLLGATAGLMPMDDGVQYYEEPYDMNRKIKCATDRRWAFEKTRYFGVTDAQKALVWHGKDYGTMAIVASIS